LNQKITLTTIGFGFNFVELTDEALVDLLQDWDEVDDIMEIDAVADLIDDSYYEYGFLVEDSLTLHVDHEDATDVLANFLVKVPSSSNELIIKSKSNLLVYQAQEDVKCSISVEKFDPERFNFVKKKLTLPNNEVRTLVSLYYGEEGFDACDTTSRGHAYIIKKNGEIIDL